jgi:hypothetical protein
VGDGCVKRQLGYVLYAVELENVDYRVMKMMGKLHGLLKTLNQFHVTTAWSGSNLS